MNGPVKASAGRASVPAWRAERPAGWNCRGGSCRDAGEFPYGRHRRFPERSAMTGQEPDADRHHRHPPHDRFGHDRPRAAATFRRRRARHGRRRGRLPDQPRHLQRADTDDGNPGGHVLRDQLAPVDPGRLGPQAALDPAGYGAGRAGLAAGQSGRNRTARTGWGTRPAETGRTCGAAGSAVAIVSTGEAGEPGLFGFWSVRDSANRMPGVRG